MSLSELLIKGMGVAFAVIGFLLLISLVGLNFLPGHPPLLVALILGFLFMGIGIYLIRGGTINL